MNMKKARKHEPKAGRTQVATPTSNVKRQGVSGYKRNFLRNTPSNGRIQVYMDRGLYENIKRFLPAIAPGVSMSSYISNIVANHVERYIDEINIMYLKSFSPIDLNT